MLAGTATFMSTTRWPYRSVSFVIGRAASPALQKPWMLIGTW